MANEKKKILLIEDNEFFSNIIANKLSIAGFDTVFVRSGEDGAAVVEKEKPDLILLDLILPGLSGLEVIEMMQKNEVTKDTPFMVFSNSSEQAMKEEAEKLGATKYLVKADHTPSTLVDEVVNFFKK